MYVVLDVGNTEPLATLPRPLLHAYEVIVPLPADAFADNVELWPLHIDVGLAEGFKVGIVLTFTVIEPLAVQLLLLVTVTLYVVLEDGDTEPPDTFPKPELLLHA